MKRELIIKLPNPTDWELKVTVENDREIRQGEIRSKSSGKTYAIVDGIVHTLGDHLAEEVQHEKEHAESFSYFQDDHGNPCPITRETLERNRNLFISLPKGDGSQHFQPGGGFDNQAGNATRFFKTLDFLNLKGGESVLEVGASFGWSSWRFAQRGCDVVALDVTNYLMAADLYFEEDGSYFERVSGDMNNLPFGDETFDLIFSHSVIHHCKELGPLFGEFRRVLKPGGRVVAIHECAFGLLEDKSGKALQEAIDEGFNENAYTLPQWKKGAHDGGFKNVQLHFFNFIDCYIDRKELRSAPQTWKLKLAYWLKAHSRLSALVNQLSILPRIILRPKSWMIIATK
ncbi:MAG: class I SAM-dependent methyltransferase [Candidatus Omnitrophota bacterium]|nr:class I SAM-dependent methyltransferase [Candidatus Omnitrophota bacterium]